MTKKNSFKPLDWTKQRKLPAGRTVQKLLRRFRKGVRRPVFRGVREREMSRWAEEILGGGFHRTWSQRRLAAGNELGFSSVSPELLGGCLLPSTCRENGNKRVSFGNGKDDNSVWGALNLRCP